MSPPPLREHSPVTEVSLDRQIVDGPTMLDHRDRTRSPLRRNPVVDVAPAETELFSPKMQKQSLPQLEPTEQKNISLFRRIPQMRSITSLLTENEALGSFSEPEVVEASDSEERGRSMIRTLDIIEARLSVIARHKEPEAVPKIQRARTRERTSSPLRRNPVDLAMITHQRNRTLSPLQRNPSNISIAKRRSRTLSPPALPSLQPIPQSASTRDDSPLHRNPQMWNISSILTENSHPASRIGTALRPKSKAPFSQTLSKFQSQAEQDSREVITASMDVTQRAIVGIFIPGSLREQAVRNLSKSRERGKSTDMGDGLRRSTSQGGN